MENSYSASEFLDLMKKHFKYLLINTDTLSFSDFKVPIEITLKVYKNKG